MAIDATLPALSTPVQPASTGLQAPPAKPAEETQGETAQTEQAVQPTEEGDSAFDNSLSAGNKEGRGKIVDLTI
jgi:hypothetical protein